MDGVIKQEEVGDRLTRHMTLFDLLAIGIGGTVGSGVMVLSGSIAYATEYPAGPSVVLSFLGSVRAAKTAHKLMLPHIM